MFDLVSLLVGGVVFLFGTILVYSVILPDSIARNLGIWFALRRNAPTWLLVPAAGAFILGLGYLVAGYGIALARVLSMVHFEPWVWISFVTGLVAMGFLILVKQLIKRRDLRRIQSGS